MADTTDDPVTAQPTRPSRLNQALAWVGIVAGGLFVVGAIFFAGFFLNWSEHMHMQMGHSAMSHEKDCCADMKMGDMKMGDMKPGDHMGAMGPGMMGPHAG
jgi:hypothetical protein